MGSHEQSWEVEITGMVKHPLRGQNGRLRLTPAQRGKYKQRLVTRLQQTGAAELEEQAKQRAGERARQLQHDRIMGYADNEDDELFKLKKHVHEKQNEQRRREEQRQRRHQQQQEDAEEQINGDENRAPARPTSPGVARDGGGNALSHEAAAAAVFDRRRNLPRPLPELPSRRMTSNSSLLNEFKTFSFDYDKQPLSELTDEMELRAKLLEPRSRMNDISV